MAVVEGDAAELCVEAQGHLPLRYQWLRHGVLLRLHTNSVMQLPSAAVEDAASYACKVRIAVCQV
jgi:hypothetical protein